MYSTALYLRFRPVSAVVEVQVLSAGLRFASRVLLIIHCTIELIEAGDPISRHLNRQIYQQNGRRSKQKQVRDDMKLKVMIAICAFEGKKFPVMQCITHSHS